MAALQVGHTVGFGVEGVRRKESEGFPNGHRIS